jgi:hypothetical protein
LMFALRPSLIDEALPASLSLFFLSSVYNVE